MKVVAVTGMHRGENPQPGPAVVAALRRGRPDLRVVALSYDPLESGLYCTDGGAPDAAFLMPFPGTGPKVLAKRLEEILARERIDFIIPCLDSEIDNFIAIGPWLKKRHGVGSLLPARKSFELRGKAHISALCADLDIPAPRTAAINDVETMRIHADAIGYPVYIKGRLYEAQLVHSALELQAAFERIAGAWGGPVLVQEPILGEEYDVVGLGDGRGGIIASCSIRKMLRTAAGKGFAGVVMADPMLDELAARMVKRLRWRGPFELEFIKPTQGRRYFLLEMNPRFPAWVDFPAQLGCNLPNRLLADLLGTTPAPLRACRPGQMFIRHCIDVVTDIGDFAELVVTGERIGRAAGGIAPVGVGR